MKTYTKRKAAGFFIVEILIVLVIIGILVAALLPNLITYTNRAKFVDVINTAAAYKPAVEACILRNNGVLTSCNNGSFGIPAVTANATTNVATNSGLVVQGVITSTGTAPPGPGGTSYLLIPSYDSTDNTVNWSDSGSPCKALGLC